jgi:hypothetical protein
MNRTSSAIALALLFFSASCSTPPSEGHFVETVPDRASFPPVAQMLVHTCGSLDCHGTAYRNLRLYGDEGQRWSPNDIPLSVPTTNDEVDQDFASVVGLEPEIMGQVVRDHGAHPERLTLVRKGRGDEAHKGGTLIHVGDDRDVCLTSWLAGNTDVAKCTAAAKE